MNIENKNIVITGASDGIGKEIAKSLSTEKTNLIICGRDKDKLNKVKIICERLGVNSVRPMEFDLKDKTAIIKATEEIKNNYKHIDVLINNAGIWQKLSPLEEVENIEDIIATNLTGQIRLTKEMLPLLKMSEEAAIINISSKSGVVAQEGQSVYTASKYGMRGFTEVLKKDLKSSNIRVAGVYQSGTNTEMFSKTGEDFPTENFTEPSDLAEVVKFMLTRPDKIWLNEVRVNY